MELVEKGVKRYKASGEDGVSPDVQKESLLDAIRAFNGSLSRLGGDQSVSALRNLGLAHRNTAKIAASAPFSDDYFLSPKERTYHFDQCLSILMQALELGTTRPAEWQDNILALLLDVYSSLCTSTRQLPIEAKLDLLPVAPRLPMPIRAGAMLESATLLHNHALKALSQKDADYKEAFRALSECHFPMMELRKLLRAHGMSTPTLEQGYAELEDSITQHKYIAESRMAIAAGDAIANFALKQADDNMMDGIWQGIDKFQEAEQLTRQLDVALRDVETEAIAIARRAELYVKVIKNESTARPLLNQAIRLAESLWPRSFHGVDWYEKCKSMLEVYRQREAAVDAAAEERQKEADRKWKDPAKAKVKAELDAIEKEAKKPGAYALLNHVYTKHPPKSDAYNAEKHLPKVTKANADTVKRVLLEAQRHYHTDKNRRATFGDEWFVLCEEISKLLNVKYQALKG